MKDTEDYVQLAQRSLRVTGSPGSQAYSVLSVTAALIEIRDVLVEIRDALRERP